MKIVLEGKFSENSRNLVRRCGYGEFINPRTGEQSFTRKLGGGIYPQFHLYINEESDRGIVLNLHLDQKKPTYAGSHAHSGEYDGELVENEAKRIKEIILGNIIG